MIGHRDKFPYADAKSFLDQTEDARALPFLIEIVPFMDEQAFRLCRQYPAELMQSEPAPKLA